MEGLRPYPLEPLPPLCNQTRLPRERGAEDFAGNEGFAGNERVLVVVDVVRPSRTGDRI